MFDRLPGALVQIMALRDRLDARIADAVGRFDEVGSWEADGSTSMTAWLKANASMTSRSARRLSAMASRLRRLPVCSAAWKQGQLSSGQVATILAHLDDSTLDAFAAAESELIPYLAPLRVAGCARAMAAWRESVADVPAPAEPERALFLWPRSMAATSSTVTSTPRAAPS